MNQSKYDRKVCGEIQIIFHILIAFAVGFYFGVSFISETATKEASVVSYAMLQKSLMIGQQIYIYILNKEIVDDLSSSINKFGENYEYLKEMAQKNFQSECKEFDNYMIDENENTEFFFNFSENFFEVPYVFYSINGFEYNPGLLRTENHEEFITFEFIKATKSGFYFKMESTDVYFEKAHFDKITLCYFAFLKYKSV